MPYIDEKKRKEVEPTLRQLCKSIDSAGTLNYLITRMCIAFTQRASKISYLTICTVIGTLFCAAIEYYKRVAGPYEMTKRTENGDVY